MLYFTIFQDKLHLVNIQDDQSCAFSETVLKISKIIHEASRFSFLVCGSTKTRNPESGNGNGITETEYGISERRFQAIDLKIYISNDNKINKKKTD